MKHKNIPYKKSAVWLVCIMLVIVISVFTAAYLHYGLNGVRVTASIIGSLIILLVFPFSLLVRLSIYITMMFTFKTDVPGEANAIIVVSVLGGEFVSMAIRNWRSFAGMMGVDLPPRGEKPALSVLYFYMLFRDIGLSFLVFLWRSVFSSSSSVNEYPSNSDTPMYRELPKYANIQGCARYGETWVGKN